MEPRKLTNEEIQNIVLLELMSPSFDEAGTEPILTQEEQDAIHKRWNEDIHSKNWEYILEPIKNPETKSRFITLLQHLDHERH